MSRAILPKLEELNLIRNNITSEGVFHLSKATWTQLQMIDLSKNIGK
jgi:hypothetical protein